MGGGFLFLLDGITYSGATGWKLLCVEEEAEELTENSLGESTEETGSGEGVSVTLLSADNAVKVKLTYYWYPKLPFVRKLLCIYNNTQSEQCLESVDVENFAVSEYFAPTFSWIYSDYGRKKSIGPYLGDIQDSLIVIHHPEWEAGIVLGNEAPGVLKGASV